MDTPNRIRIEICGSKYVISSPEAPDYVRSLSAEIEDHVKHILDTNNSATLCDAYLLTLLSYADQYRKSEDSCDNLRSQLTEYLEDATKARIEADEGKQEIEKLKRDIVILRQNVESANKSRSDAQQAMQEIIAEREAEAEARRKAEERVQELELEKENEPEPIDPEEVKRLRQEVNFLRQNIGRNH